MIDDRKYRFQGVRALYTLIVIGTCVKLAQLWYNIATICSKLFYFFFELRLVSGHKSIAAILNLQKAIGFRLKS